MGRRNRVRLPRDMASREPYVPAGEDEDLVSKFDDALSRATADSDGWRVITRRAPSSRSDKPGTKPPTMSLAAASAAFDAVIPATPDTSGSVAPATPSAPITTPTSTPSVMKPERNGKHEEIAKKAAQEAVGMALPAPEAKESDPVKSELVKKVASEDEGFDEDFDADVDLDVDADADIDAEPDDVADEPEPKVDPEEAERRRELHKRSSMTTTRSSGRKTTRTGRPAAKSSKKAKAEKEVKEEKRAPKRPARTGRGLGRRSAKHIEIVSSVNPMVEEAISTAAAELAPHPGQDGGAERLDDEDRQGIEDFTAVARSPSTLATYRSDLRQFSDWCAQKGIRSFPAEPRVVAAWASFLAKKKKLKFDQIERRVAAISAAHVALDHQSPSVDQVVKNVMVGIKSALEADQNGIAPLSPADLTAIVTDAPKTARWRRNKAMLLLGFSAALRRSELVEIRMEGLRFDDEGLVLVIPRRLSEGVETVRIPTVDGKLCTVGALARWITTAGIKRGYVFRKTKDGGAVDPDPDRHLPARSVTKIVKEAVKLIGLDPRRYTGRSLRIGYSEAVQEAARKTIKDIDYVRQTLRPQVL